MAPILSFTTDELWQHLPGERNESVMLNGWYEKLTPLAKTTELDVAFWSQIFAVRDAVSKQLEVLRNDGKIKSGLTAEVTLFAEEGLKTLLDKVEPELKFILISSKVSLMAMSDKPGNAVESELAGLALFVEPTEHARCDRCWHQTEEVGQNETHPELCGRCVDNIEGEGEQRHYA
jgi:isoleucyl-tRNA synthetase